MLMIIHPSQTTIVQWVDPSYGPNSNAVASMQIKASVSIDHTDVITMLLAILLWQVRVNQTNLKIVAIKGLRSASPAQVPQTPDTAKLSVHKELNGNLFHATGTKTITNIPRGCKGKFAILVKSLESASTSGLAGLGQADTIANANYKATGIVSLVPRLALQVQVFGTKVISTSIELKPTAEFNYEKAGHGAIAGTRDFCVNLKLSAAFQAQILQGMSGQCNVAGSSGKKTVYRS
ncbi:hypothetical protein BASA81_005087 [Batrachochytrium salamandrivorans]|nr:hypothetical protein BASA81_005087 [Batrachochytrium salamandrivorans]